MSNENIPTILQDTAQSASDNLTPLSRRQFLERATLSSTALLLAGKGVGAEAGRVNHSVRARHAAYYSLAPGDVSPDGWLRLYLQKQADQLASHLPEVSWPFTEAYWSGQETPPDGSDSAWWPWEQKAYWTDGALRCALALRDERLLRQALVPVDYTLNHVSDDGFIGPIFTKEAELKHPEYGNFRWFHTVFFRALAAHGEATQDPRVAEAMRRHYLADVGRARYGASRDVTNVEGMLWAYEHTGDSALLAMAEKTWRDYQTGFLPGDEASGDLHPDRVYANTPVLAHGVTYSEQAKLPALLYMHTGNPEYLKFAIAAQERLFTHHMLIDGIPSASEIYHETGALEAHETCDITDHMWSWGYLLMASGDGIWADRIERACFNAGFGAIKKDWKAVQYFSGPNQFLADQHSNHVTGVPYDTPWMAFAPNPGHESACCGANVHRFFPNYVIRMWMADPQGGLAAMLYGASTVRAKVGPAGQEVEIRQETNYPFEEDIHFAVISSAAVRFPLRLRIPGWCKTPQLSLNGSAIPLPAIEKGFVRVDRVFHPGDRLTLSLPMHTELSYWPAEGRGITHGPLVFALAIKESWTPVVTPRWSTEDFPEWNAEPVSPWNYGYAGNDLQVLTQTRVERKGMTADPWVSSPITLSVPLKKIPGWELRADPRHPEHRLTPPLPVIDDDLYESLEKTEVEQLALVPYGSSHLRLAIFRKVSFT